MIEVGILIINYAFLVIVQRKTRRRPKINKKNLLQNFEKNLKNRANKVNLWELKLSTLLYLNKNKQ